MKPVWIVLLVIGGLFLFVMLLTVLYLVYAFCYLFCIDHEKRKEKRSRREMRARQNVQDQSVGRESPESFESSEGVMSFDQAQGDRSSLGVQPLTPQMVVAGRPQPQVYQFR